MKGIAASLDQETINNLASYYASLHPEQPASGKNTTAKPAPVLLANQILASLDQRAIDNVASYYASLHPEQPASAKNTAAKPAPVVTANRLLASLDQRAIDNVASYYATLTPAQPEIAKNAPRVVPASVREAAPVGRRSIGGIISFRLDDPTYSTEEVNQVCLNCHEKGQRTLWQGSVHEVRGLACANCHTVMRNVTPKFALAQLTEPDVCFQCHKKQRADIWQSSHMPVREGKMTCSSCHNPHGSYSEALLKTATVNDTCYKCHAEKRGPFLWEHPPVRENCLNCHDPHGSINDSLLKVSRPRLCQQCHTAADHPGNPGNPMAVYSIGGACSNCHVRIHGSNSPAGAEFVR
jgi:DmsE family decaheme c-type cytochrome